MDHNGSNVGNCRTWLTTYLMQKSTLTVVNEFFLFSFYIELSIDEMEYIQTSAQGICNKKNNNTFVKKCKIFYMTFFCEMLLQILLTEPACQIMLIHFPLSILHHLQTVLLSLYVHVSLSDYFLWTHYNQRVTYLDSLSKKVINYSVFLPTVHP